MADQREFFCDCVRQWEKNMYILALGIVKNEEDASDIMQESILKAYRSMDDLRDKRKAKSWLLSIVHNTAVESLRKRRDTVDIDEQWELAELEPSIDAETRLTVWEAVQKLKMPYRTVVVLFYYDELPVRKIAEITSASPVAVRKQLFRARKMLAELLRKEDFDL